MKKGLIMCFLLMFAISCNAQDAKKSDTVSDTVAEKKFYTKQYTQLQKEVNILNGEIAKRQRTMIEIEGILKYMDAQDAKQKTQDNEEKIDDEENKEASHK